MMLIKMQVKLSIATIYYWIHNDHPGLTKADMPYPRNSKHVKKQPRTNSKPAGKSIQQSPEVIDIR